MPDDSTGPPSGGPPSYPGNAQPPPMPPPMPPPPPPPRGLPSYPNAPSAEFSTAQAQFVPAGTLVSPSGTPYATWGVRLGGYLIDLVIFIPVLIVLFVLFRHSHTLNVQLMSRRHGEKRQQFSLLTVILEAILYIGYTTILCGGRRGQTVGMMAVGVRVVRGATEGTLGYGLALGRSLVEQVFRVIALLSILLGVVWLLDMLWPLWDKKRQTLHDKVVGTVVLRTKNTG